MYYFESIMYKPDIQLQTSLQRLEIILNILATTYYFHLNCIFKLLTPVDLCRCQGGELNLADI